MNGYPEGSLEHNVPFIVASGLNATANELPLPEQLRDNAILIKSELPPLESKEADVLEAYFEEVDKKSYSWKGVAKDEPYRFRIRTIGRSLRLPPRKASLPETDEKPDTSSVLHSPFSPLSPASSLYHDGLIDEHWIQKHQELVPSIVLSFCSLTSDPNTMILQDNKLKTDLNTFKTALMRSGYKTRLAIILMGENSHGPMAISEGLNERLEAIRRGAALDPKSIFYIPPQDSPTDLTSVMDNILGVLYNTSVEYYRDLGRHARKKRARGIAPPPTVPPTSGTSRNLTLPDWNFRYDFKAGVLAEFRQEADAAMRSFEQAYEILLGQDVLDIIPSWSPRWNDARLLADIISIRCLRLHFWMGHTSMAVRRWQLHRDRISDFVDRRGKGTNCYGWHAWEARWATIMATLIETLEIPGLVPPSATLYLQPEKSLLGDRLQPWELLHHTGYWHRIAARHLVIRRKFAHIISDEDRVEPDPAVAGKKTFSYDTYLCPEPHEEYPLDGTGANHSKLIIDALTLARQQFEARDQKRFCAEIALECATEYVNTRSWNEAITTLQPLWEDLSFRGEHWTDVAEDLCWLMRRAGAETGRADLVITADWELMNKKFTRRPQWPYDLRKSLDGMSVDEKPVLSLKEGAVGSFVSASFVFRNKESKAGQTCTAQLSITSFAFADATPVVLHSIRIESKGALKPIVLEHGPSQDDTGGKLVILPISLTEQFSENSDDDLPLLLRGTSDLTLKPGQTRVFELTIPLRESGDAEITSLTLGYRSEAFDLDYSMSLSGANQAGGWKVSGSEKAKHSRLGAHVLHIQPKPPKLEVKLVDVRDQYYANETIELQVELRNAEDEAASVKLDVQLVGKDIPSFKLRLAGDEKPAEEAEDGFKLLNQPIGSIPSSESYSTVLVIDPAEAPTVYEIQIRALYHLESDPATPIMQVLPVTLNIVNAFEANYDLVPRLHPDPWPSLFDPDGVQEATDKEHSGTVSAKGFAQKWCLKCHYASFASQDLQVMGMEAKVLSSIGGARCHVVQGSLVPEGGITIGPKTMHDASFDLVAQKISLDDRSPVSLELAFVIHWRRGDVKSEDTVNTTTMPVGKYLVLGTEPRVLATVARAEPGTESWAPGVTWLSVTIENPSSHFLTFGLSMEPSDEFAFSGAKQTTVHLLPMARRKVTYRLVPMKGGWVRPGLVVRDKYFQKVLRIIPTEGMRIDKEGLLIWMPGEEDRGETDADSAEGEEDVRDP
ncbi:hypothetical protein NLU13_7889 [Sarocladium strictum]|uniref:Uncharacterized protein n=1 Tax=Sarocladium strictum TaxID=5046 RepID=A0AA39L5Z2_SARSR|nr:hypothetical protein NLU13_7889 [Sarocladium strictum]